MLLHFDFADRAQDLMHPKQALYKPKYSPSPTYFKYSCFFVEKELYCKCIFAVTYIADLLITSY